MPYFNRLYLVTKVLLNLDQFHNILATIQYFKFWKLAIMDQLVTFRKRVYRVNVISLSMVLSCTEVCHDLKLEIENCM